MLQHGPALASKTPEVYVPGVQALFANFAAGLTHQASIHETELVGSCTLRLPEKSRFDSPATCDQSLSVRSVLSGS